MEEQDRARAILPDLGPCPIVLSRATTSFGQFSVDVHDGDMEIRISKHITDERQVRETARHELAHQAAWERYTHIGHGPLWQMFASYLGCSPTPCSETSFAADILRARARYAIRCTRCGQTSMRQRRSRLVDRPHRYACARCGGKLEVELLAAMEP